jgi:hypothetical protein
VRVVGQHALPNLAVERLRGRSGGDAIEDPERSACDVDPPDVERVEHLCGAMAETPITAEDLGAGGREPVELIRGGFDAAVSHLVEELDPPAGAVPTVRREHDA